MGPDPSARSDLRMFGSDNNNTVSKMKDPAVYQQTCAKVLQKMIDTVPSGVKLTEAIEVYPVKPSNIQLNVAAGGDQLLFTGQVRVRTNDVPKADISKVEIEYKDRDGSKSGKIVAEALGDATGFDDAFTFYGFDSEISAETSISSFNVIVTLNSGGTKLFDNNGKSFPVSDKIFAQTADSSLSASTGSGQQKLNIVAAIRNGDSPTDLALTITTINPIVYNSLPTYTKNSVKLVKDCQSKYYTFYSAGADVSTAQVNGTKYDVSFSSGGVSYSDSFNSINTLPSTANAPSCDGGSSSTTTSKSSVTTASTTAVTSSGTTKAPSTTESTSYTTTVVTRYTTFCPFATTFTEGDQVFTVTEATTLTITNCPCTITVPVVHTSTSASASDIVQPASTSRIASDGVQPTSTLVIKPEADNSQPAPSTAGQPNGASTVAPASTGTTTTAVAPATFTGAAGNVQVMGPLTFIMAFAAAAYTMFMV